VCEIVSLVTSEASSDSNEKDINMQERGLTIPEINLICGTRVALGARLAMVLGDRLRRETRRGAGWALFAIGALSTIPLVLGVLGKPVKG